VNAHNNCNCKDDKKAYLIGYSDHALDGGECLLTSITGEALKKTLAHSSDHALDGGECLLTSITGEALKKTLAHSSDHFPEVVNACSQESLRQD
jgi:hypothetical protein